MTYYPDRPTNQVVEPAIVNPVVDYHDRVRWGPIVGGIAIAISTQLILSALGAAIGLSLGAGGANAGDVGLGVGLWSIISLLIALFLGGWIMAATCGPMNKKTALLNAAILWATTLALSSWLLVSGISGTFGVIASNAGQLGTQTPSIDAAQARSIAGSTARAAWSFLFGSLLGLIAAMIGASIGARKPRVYS